MGVENERLEAGGGDGSETESVMEEEKIQGPVSIPASPWTSGTKEGNNIYPHIVYNTQHVTITVTTFMYTVHTLRRNKPLTNLIYTYKLHSYEQ